MRKLFVAVLTVATLVLPSTPAHAVSAQCGRGVRPWRYAAPRWCHYYTPAGGNWQ